MTESIDRTVIGTRIRRMREYCGYSQQEVATYLQVPRTAVTQIESGSRRVDAVELSRLAELFQCAISDLVDEEIQSEMNEDIQLVARATKGLSEADREEVLRFAQFLKIRSRGRRDGGKAD